VAERIEEIPVLLQKRMSAQVARSEPKASEDQRAGKH